MTSSFKLVFAVCLLLQLLDLCKANKVGVAYGRDANNLPSPDRVAQLVRDKNIQYIRIYDSDPQVLRAFANTGIELMVGVHNEDLSAFQSPSYVDSWFKSNILPFYPATKITDITVGVEVTERQDINAPNLVLPAMRNVVAALKSSNLQDRIKVSTPLSFGVLSISSPPSEGAFKSSLEFVLRPLLEFLDENQSPFMINLYPYFAIDASSLEYVLFEPAPVFRDPNTGFSYTNMFDAQLDAVYYAIMNRNFRPSGNMHDAHAQIDNVRSSLANSRQPKIIVTETGLPTSGSPGDKHATTDNARIYNNNLIRHVTSGSGTPAMSGGVRRVNDDSGTPAMSGAKVDVYIFSLFDENQKQGPEIEGHWGIFNPDMTSKYNVDFPGKGTNTNGRTWCVASSQASNSNLQNALDFACGKADCSAIQPGQQCFEPNNLVSHASFAINNYYQMNGATDEACRFGGTGIKVNTDPSYGNCIYDYFPGKGSNTNRRTWCVASSQASNSNLQNALDFACGAGKADCSSIQPGQQCFEPNNLVSHASFAFNNYYQKNGATDEACRFGGTGIKVNTDPSYGNCIYHCKYKV